MNSNQTSVKGTSGDSTASEKSFAFDHSYWSFDGFKTEPSGYLSPSKGSNYIDQKRIYSDLGSQIVKNAFDGFNATLFAYGQTGSGKLSIFCCKRQQTVILKFLFNTRKVVQYHR